MKKRYFKSIGLKILVIALVLGLLSQNVLADNLTQTQSTSTATQVKLNLSTANFALSANGATVIASSTTNIPGMFFPAQSAIQGNRSGTNWEQGGGWHGANSNSSDWIKVYFNGYRTINEIDLFTLQDNYKSPLEPTDTMTFTAYGITDFDIQYYNGATWVTIPGGSVIGNNKVWIKATFPYITTNGIRVLVHKAQNSFSRIVDIEAYGINNNYASLSNGAKATSSSEMPGFSAQSTLTGNRRGIGWCNEGGWNDNTNGIFPDWLQVEFNGQKTLNEIDLFTLQDNFGNPLEPNEDMKFTKYGIAKFDVQYFDGTDWKVIPGGSVIGNDKVFRKFKFSDITTNRIRVVVYASVPNSAFNSSRIVDIEAYGSSDILLSVPVISSLKDNFASALNGATATSSSEMEGFSAQSALFGNRRGINWTLQGGWDDNTYGTFPDWLQVDFNQIKTVNEIDIYTLQDNYYNPIEPNETTTFTKYGITDFDVQYFDGTNWITVQNGSIRGNNKVCNKIIFPSVTTKSIRVTVSGAVYYQPYYNSRIVNIEAYNKQGTGNDVPTGPYPTYSHQYPAFEENGYVHYSANTKNSLDFLDRVIKDSPTYQEVKKQWGIDDSTINDSWSKMEFYYGSTGWLTILDDSLKKLESDYKLGKISFEEMKQSRDVIRDLIRVSYMGKNAVTTTREQDDFEKVYLFESIRVMASNEAYQEQKMIQDWYSMRPYLLGYEQTLEIYRNRENMYIMAMIGLLCEGILLLRSGIIKYAAQEETVLGSIYSRKLQTLEVKLTSEVIVEFNTTSLRAMGISEEQVVKICNNSAGVKYIDDISQLGGTNNVTLGTFEGISVVKPQGEIAPVFGMTNAQGFDAFKLQATNLNTRLLDAPKYADLNIVIPELENAENILFFVRQDIVKNNYLTNQELNYILSHPDILSKTKFVTGFFAPFN